MRKYFFTLIIFLLITKVYGQNGWVPVQTPFDGVLDFQFINSQTGYICGYNGKAAKTTDGGVSWTSFTGFDSTIHFKTLNFINSNTGWIGAWKNLGYPFTPFQNDVYSTTNGGANWNLVYRQSATDQLIADICLLSKDSVIIGNSGSQGFVSTGSLMQTYNSGASFQSNLYIQNFEYYSIKFLNKNTGWVLCDYGSDTGPQKHRIYKTTNSGFSWDMIYRDSVQPKQITDIHFINENTGFLAGLYGRFARTTNSGTNWQNLNSANFFCRTIFFFDENTGFTGGSGDSSALRRTTDSGNNWTYMRNNNILGSISKINFINSLTGWALGSGYPLTSYSLMKTITGGLTSVQTAGNILPDKFSLSQNYPNPFNPTTRINYELPIGNYVQLKVYDALGNEVETLVNEKQNAGSYSVNFKASELPSGIYFYKLAAEKFTETKKMLLIK